MQKTKVKRMPRISDRAEHVPRDFIHKKYVAALLMGRVSRGPAIEDDDSLPAAVSRS
jgi:hypothetical protein